MLALSFFLNRGRFVYDLKSFGSLEFNTRDLYIIHVQFDLSYPAMSGPALIRIRDLAGYGETQCLIHAAAYPMV